MRTDGAKGEANGCEEKAPNEGDITETASANGGGKNSRRRTAACGRSGRTTSSGSGAATTDNLITNGGIQVNGSEPTGKTRKKIDVTTDAATVDGASLAGKTKSKKAPTTKVNKAYDETNDELTKGSERGSQARPDRRKRAKPRRKASVQGRTPPKAQGEPKEVTMRMFRITIIMVTIGETRIARNSGSNTRGVCSMRTVFHPRGATVGDQAIIGGAVILALRNADTIGTDHSTITVMKLRAIAINFISDDLRGKRSSGADWPDPRLENATEENIDIIIITPTGSIEIVQYSPPAAEGHRPAKRTQRMKERKYEASKNQPAAVTNAVERTPMHTMMRTTWTAARRGRSRTKFKTRARCRTSTYVISMPKVTAEADRSTIAMPTLLALDERITRTANTSGTYHMRDGPARGATR